MSFIYINTLLPSLIKLHITHAKEIRYIHGQVNSIKIIHLSLDILVDEVFCQWFRTGHIRGEKRKTMDCEQGIQSDSYMVGMNRQNCIWSVATFAV